MSQGDHSPDAPRWRYRRSLASRVILLTTIAVGVSVTFVSVGAFVTVRMQLKSSLDDSLIDHARAAAPKVRPYASHPQDLPVSRVQLAASDVLFGMVYADGSRAMPKGQSQIALDRHEVAVARGDVGLSLRTVRSGHTDYRVVAFPTGTAGSAVFLAQSLDPQEDLLFKLGLVSLFFGLAGIIAAGMAGWAVATNGLRPVRRLTSSVEGIARTEDLAPLAVEGDDDLRRMLAVHGELVTGETLVARLTVDPATPLTETRLARWVDGSLTLLPRGGWGASAGGRFELRKTGPMERDV